VAERIKEIVPTGLDHAVEASGVPSVMAQALACVRPRGGQAVVIGNARYGELLEIDPKELNLGKRLLGTWGGDCEPDRDFPLIARSMRSGTLPIDRLAGGEYGLLDINSALADLANGQVHRPVIKMENS
jgi:S-(hydroxymethyl)glutathione dehydrogenase/alcohol dehydrogenase